MQYVVAIKKGLVPFNERFEREAHAIASLNHPYICSLFDVGPDYLVMDYVEGRQLAGPLPLDEAVTVAGQISGRPTWMNPATIGSAEPSRLTWLRQRRMERH